MDLEQPILVTGGSGFIGGRLVEALLQRGARLRVLVRTQSTVPVSWPAHLELCPGDLDEPDSLSLACRGVGTLFHAAGHAHSGTDHSPREVERHWRVNALGTRQLLEAAARSGVKRFIFLSSVMAMGEGGKRCVGEDWPLPPRTPYGRAKRDAEQAVIETGQRQAMHVVNLRLAMVYGAGGKGNLRRMAGGIRQGWFPPLPEVGNRRSMVHVSDVVQAALLAAADPAANGRSYIVTDGRDYSGREIYDLIRRELGKAASRWSVPAVVLRAAASLGDGLGLIVGRSVGFDSAVLDKLLGWACYRCDKIQRELGYRPTRTLIDSLPEILASG